MITTDIDNDMFVQKTGEKQLVCERECVCVRSVGKVYIYLCAALTLTFELHWSIETQLTGAPNANMHSG